jgi:hypothetical protein
MIANFDLNIGNYSKNELEEILGLPINYDESIVEMQESKMRQNIINDSSIPATIKTKTLNFITNIKNKLVVGSSTISNAISNANSSSSSNIDPLVSGVNNLTKTYKNVYNLDKQIHRSEIDEQGSSFIIKKKELPYGQSLPSEFYQGTINPLNKRILKQNINIDTRFRENYYATQSSNFHLDLPIKLSQVVSMQLSALELPTTFYSISKTFGNNFFVLKIAGEEPLIITIPDGNYTYLNLQDYLNKFIFDLGLPFTAYKTINFLADINTPGGSTTSGSGKMIVGSTDGTLQFSINFQTDKNGAPDSHTPLPLKLGWIFGFREGYYTEATKYVSEGVLDILGPKYIYLVVDDFNNNVSDGFYGAFTASLLNKNILARITIQSSIFSISSQNNFNLITSPRQYFGPVDVQKLQIQLLDEYGRILDLNNMDFSFCLTFQTVYDL